MRVIQKGLDVGFLNLYLRSAICLPVGRRTVNDGIVLQWGISMRECVIVMAAGSTSFIVFVSVTLTSLLRSNECLVNVIEGLGSEL